MGPSRKGCTGTDACVGSMNGSALYPTPNTSCSAVTAALVVANANLGLEAISAWPTQAALPSVHAFAPEHAIVQTGLSKQGHEINGGEQLGKIGAL